MGPSNLSARLAGDLQLYQIYDGVFLYVHASEQDHLATDCYVAYAYVVGNF